jgi:hypothetical protein
MRGSVLAVLLAFPALASARTYSLSDSGDFAPAGLRVEFADRYGWTGYKARFDFGLDEERQALSADSKLSVEITKRDGSSWSYSCKAKKKNELSAGVNRSLGGGYLVVARCVIPESKFAKAVNLDAEDVGRPALVFEAIVQDGSARAGAQRGIEFMPGAGIESSDLSAYAQAATADLTGLAVVFKSN